MPLAIDQAGAAVMSSLCYVGWDTACTGLSSLKNRPSSLSFTVFELHVGRGTYEVALGVLVSLQDLSLDGAPISKVSVYRIQRVSCA